MAVFKSDVMNKQTVEQAGKLSPVDFGGRVRLVHGCVTPATAPAVGDVIELAKLPRGARILPISRLHFEAGQGATATVKVGDSGDDDRYLAAKAPGASETTVELVGNRLGSYTLPAEDTVKATVGTAALTAGKKIAFDLFYVID